MLRRRKNYERLENKFFYFESDEHDSFCQKACKAIYIFD